MTDDAAAVARFAFEARWVDLPLAVQTRARWALADTLGVTLAGRPSRAGNAAALMASAENGSTQLVGCDGATSPVMAALANGVAASALDFDDGHYLAGGIHPGAPVISTLLSVSGPTTTWGELLCAQTVGYEVAIQAGRLLAPATPTSEYHTSGTAGALGAAVGAAKLLGLDEDGILRALRIASAHAPVARLQLSMVKESIGWSAATAVAAAQMAATGFDDASVPVHSLPSLGGFPATPFDGSTDTDDDASHVASFVAPFGSRWEILSTYVKPYACCRVIHAALDGLLTVMRREELDSSDLRRVVVSTIRGGVGLDFVAPPTLEHAQFSFPFAIGTAAVRGRLGACEMVEATLRDPKVADIGRRVVIEHKPELDDRPTRNYPAEVVMTGPRGSFAEEVNHAHGSAEVPMSEAELEAKFRSSAMTMLPVERVDQLLPTILESSPETELGDFHSWLGI